MDSNNTDCKASSKYNMQDLHAPVLTGSLLTLFSYLSGISLVKAKLASDNGMFTLVHMDLPEQPTYFPVLPPSDSDQNATPTFTKDLPSLLTGTLPEEQNDNRAITALDYHKAYLTGEVTPVDVAKRVVEAMKASQSDGKEMNLFIDYDVDLIMRMAQDSTDRYKKKVHLSVLDGVPIAVKDEIDMLPYPTTLGNCKPVRTPSVDATVVDRLRRAGAVMIGKTNMVEIGAGVIGENMHYGWPRNPYNTNHSCSGSSSGSAGAVAAGICPIALGADGGGSIRLPAAVTGVVGLKCTFGRVSESGVYPLCPTLGHVGPIGATVQDVAAMYQVIAGPDDNDNHSLNQPPVSLHGLGESTAMHNKVIGIYWEWFEHCDPEVVDICKSALARLTSTTGIIVKPIEIPMLDQFKIGQSVTIISEMLANLSPVFDKRWNDFSPITRSFMNLATSLQSRDYIAAQKLRTQALSTMQEVFTQCDFVVTPTCGWTAPEMASSAVDFGVLDATTTGRMMRYVGLGNFTGLPAISVPCGYSEKHLPVGLQIMGPWWSERE
eukprot:Ihof_evm12s43 gene=Ihof_evmTU12s43